MSTATNTKLDAKSTNADTDQGSLVILDIGKKQRKKRIRRLRKGRGKLFNRVRDLVEEMKEDGTIDSGAQPVVIVVRQKGKKSPFGLRFK